MQRNRRSKWRYWGTKETLEEFGFGAADKNRSGSNSAHIPTAAGSKAVWRTWRRYVEENGAIPSYLWKIQQHVHTYISAVSQIWPQNADADSSDILCWKMEWQKCYCEQENYIKEFGCANKETTCVIKKLLPPKKPINSPLAVKH